MHGTENKIVSALLLCRPTYLGRIYVITKFRFEIQQTEKRHWIRNNTKISV